MTLILGVIKRWRCGWRKITSFNLDDNELREVQIIMNNYGSGFNVHGLELIESGCLIKEYGCIRR